jgi:hypothetical protein
MTTEAQRVQTILNNDSSIVNLFTGGIYTREEIGKAGLTFTKFPEIYDSNGVLKPTCFIRVRNSFNDDSGLDDWDEKVFTTRRGLEIQIVDNDHMQNLETGRDLIVKALHTVILDSRIYMFSGERGERQAEEFSGGMEDILDFMIRRIN